jgi:hypothetical protein
MDKDAVWAAIDSQRLRTAGAKHPFVSAGLEAHLTLENIKGLIFVIMDMRRRPLTRREATRH